MKQQDLNRLQAQLEYSKSISKVSDACKWLCHFTKYVPDPLVKQGKKKEKNELPSNANKRDAKYLKESPSFFGEKEFPPFMCRRKSIPFENFNLLDLHILSQVFSQLDINSRLNTRAVCKRWGSASQGHFAEYKKEFNLLAPILASIPTSVTPNPWLKDTNQYVAVPEARRKSIDKLLGDIHKGEKSIVQILVLSKNVDRPSIPFALFENEKEEEGEHMKPGTCAFKQVERVFFDIKFRFIVMTTDPNEEINNKLLPMFQDVTSILFFVPSARYDQITPRGQNILLDSAEYLQRISHSYFMRKVPIILFFTQSDLFQDKVDRVNLRTVFPQYTGSIAGDAKTFVQSLFCERAHVDSYCYLCWTGKVNDEQEFLFLATRDIVLRNAFMNHGILA